MDSEKIADLARIALKLEKDSFEQLVAYATIGKILVERSLDVRNFSNNAPETLEIFKNQNQESTP